MAHEPRKQKGTSSLATRLFMSAAAWVVVILILTGFALSSVYRQAVERSFDRRLNLYLRTLIAEVVPPPGDGDDKTSQALGEPLFELPLSGWYWQITRLDSRKPDVRSSRSLWDRKLPKLEDQGVELNAAGLRLGYVVGPEDQQLRVVERPVDLGSDGRYNVTVAGDATEIFEETRTFDYYLSGTFVALTMGLLLTTLFQVRFGLALLKRMLTEESGRTLIFVRTKRATERLAEKLNRHGLNVSVLHGDRSQSQRNSALTAFQHGKSRVLVATDVASRGIHVDDIAQVINYDLPAIPEDFIHRVGRTGRAGATGSAITFYSGVERSDLARIERTLQLKMRRGQVESDLVREERAMPVDVSGMRPEPVKPGSRMVRLPGEVLQRYSV